MEEIWKDIPGYEGYYQVSSIGRVKSLARLDCHVIRPTQPQVCRPIAEKVLSTLRNNNGYLFIFLRINGKRKKFYIHRLVAFVFIPDGDPALEVNHRNKDRCNNCLSNLEWMTTKENAYHRDHYQETVDEPF